MCSVCVLALSPGLLDSLIRVPEPGGILFLDDADPIIYTVQSPPPPEDAPTPDVVASLTAQLAWQGDPHLPRIRPWEQARCRVHICVHCGAQNEP